MEILLVGAETPISVAVNCKRVIICASAQTSFKKLLVRGCKNALGREQSFELRAEQRCELHHHLRICTDKFQKSYW
jgi:hypothetical protein